MPALKLSFSKVVTIEMQFHECCRFLVVVAVVVVFLWVFLAVGIAGL